MAKIHEGRKASPRIPQGYTLTISIADEDAPGDVVSSRIVHAEARDSARGVILGSPGDPGWPMWAEAYLNVLLRPMLDG